MPGPKPQVERKRHFEAYKIYRDLGFGRTFQEVHRQVGASVTSVSKWSRWFSWDERIANHNITVEKKEEAGDLLKSNDPIGKRLVNVMNKMDALIDSAFIEGPDGKFSPTNNLKVKNVEELTKFISEYRKYLETYHKFVAEFMPADKESKKNVNIREFNVNMGNVSQEERVDILKGLANGNVPRGDKQSGGGVQDADYTDLPEPGDEDGSGRDGVPGSPASGSSGDETPVRKS